MEELLYYCDLYDLYGSLLTEKQQEYFKDYYFNNLSFSEISENYDVSRNAVFKQIHIAVDKLKEYDDKLKLLDKKKIVEEIISIEENSIIKEKLEELF